MKKLSKMLKKLLTKKTLDSLILFGFIATIFRFELHQVYIHNHLYSKVNAVQMAGIGGLKTIGTASQIKYRGKRFTITNLHVCTVADLSVRIGEMTKIPDHMLVGKSIILDGKKRKILAISKEHDLCLVEPILEQGALSIASTYYLQQEVFLIGHPRGLPRTVRSGHIIAWDKSIFPGLSMTEQKPFIWISSITYPGNSGSPVVNVFGNIVGLLFARERGYHTEGMVVPLEAVQDFLELYYE